MANENENMTNGDTPAQSATGQPTGVNNQVAPDQTQGDTTAQPATDANTPEDPQAQLQAEIEQQKQANAELQANYQALQQQVQMMAVSQQPATPAAQQQPATPTADDPYAEWEGYDYVPLEAARKRDVEIRQHYDQRFNDLSGMVFNATHPDYDEVVGPIDPVTGQMVMSDHLKKALTKNPALVQWIKGQPDTIKAKEAAYQIAKQEQALTGKSVGNNTPNPDLNATAAAAQAYAENSASARLQPGSAAAVGGDGAVNSQTNVATMDLNTPEGQAAFDQHERDILSGRFEPTK